MVPNFNNLPRRNVMIDPAVVTGNLEGWRHVQGLGGINSLPLPERVAKGISGFKPRLLRIFLQEFFFLYPETGRFDWAKLDVYMDAVAATGAKIVAAIAIKPKPLFPVIDQNVWRPKSVEEWQAVIAAIVRRYSVERKIVSHWEVGNEVDIGEWGGCPYLIKDPKAYGEYYEMTAKGILQAFSEAKVGGPALAGYDSAYLAGFMEYCVEKKLQLDFVSWHLYGDDPAKHVELVEKARAVIAKFAPLKPEMMVTEWSKFFDQVSVQDLALSPRQSANIAAILLAYLDSGVDWTCFYHCWDQTAYPEEFAPFFSDPRIMTEHWDEIPHRFGIFGVNEEVRPQFFVFQMLSRMAGMRVKAESDDPCLKAVATVEGKRGGRATVLLVNFDLQAGGSRDVIATLRFARSGARRKLRAWRIDEKRRWCEKSLELEAMEEREVAGSGAFRCQFYCPADSVMLVELAGE